MRKILVEKNPPICSYLINFSSVLNWICAIGQTRSGVFPTQVGTHRDYLSPDGMFEAIGKYFRETGRSQERTSRSQEVRLVCWGARWGFGACGTLSTPGCPTRERSQGVPLRPNAQDNMQKPNAMHRTEPQGPSRAFRLRLMRRMTLRVPLQLHDSSSLFIRVTTDLGVLQCVAFAILRFFPIFL